MEASIGVNLRVTAHSNQGGRKYMEDMFCVAYQPTADDRDLLYAYFGIFDGHGGREAALYAKHHLMDQIVSQKNFWSDDDELVLKAIRDGFLATHYAMWKELEKWPKTPSGLPSTSGTTASIAFVRRGKLYIGHVGDSGIVLGYEDPDTGFWKAKPLTKDHKPESPSETSRIMEAGGKVIVKSGVPRVVWNRPRIGHKGPVRRSTHMDEIPFLAVARSLGDLWSYNSEQNEFIVSPEPDVSVFEIDVHSHRCLILGTDGLWNMLSPQDAVNSVYFAEKNNEKQPPPAPGSPDPSKTWINPSKRLVDRALDRWLQHSLRADNTSVVTVVVDPPGPPKDPAASPVGISRYVPQPCSSTVVHKPKPRDRDSGATIPSSAAPSSSKAASVAHARVVKAASVADTSTQNITPNTSRVVRAKLYKSTKRGSPSTEPTTSNRDIDVPHQSSQATSASSSSSSRYWRDSHRSSPVVSHDSHQQQRSVHDDVQIHEISSSSESTKSESKTPLSKKRKLKTTMSVRSSKRLKVETKTVRKPVTRKVASISLPKPSSSATGKTGRLRSSTVIAQSAKTLNKGKTVPRKLTKISPTTTKQKPTQSKTRASKVAKKAKSSESGRNEGSAKSQKVGNSRTLRSATRSLSRNLRKK